MGMALVNTLAAIDEGVTWLDATVLGMGRGAGNLRTEILMMELARRYGRAGQPEALFSLVLNEFDALHRLHGWGPSLLYYLAAAYEIHPSYVQVMLQGDRYRPEDVLTALRDLKNGGAHSYSADRLQTALGGGTILHTEGTWNATGWAKSRTVLIIGPGKGAREHQDALLQYIDRTNPLVVCLNAKTSFPRDKIDLYAVCHLARQVVEAPMYRSFGRPVAIPVGNVPESIRSNLAGVDVLDYGLKVQDGKFEIGPTGCTLPRMLVAGYVFALASAAGAQRLLLAGFDGYPPSDPLFGEMQTLLDQYRATPGAAPVIAVTPSTYAVHHQSIYSPHL
jgi:4-hydroxy 2-oxovalerate aldolase